MFSRAFFAPKRTSIPTNYKLGRSSPFDSLRFKNNTFKRSFADEAAKTSATDLLLTFAVPYDVFYNKQPVHVVRVPGLSGEFGILKDHVPEIAQLKPGIIKKDKDGRNLPEEEFFVSGGWAFMHRDSTCSVNAIEAFPLTDFDPDVAKENFRKYQADVAKAANEEERSKAMVGLEVHQALCAALKLTV